MSKEMYTATSAQSTALDVRTGERPKKRKRTGFFSGLVQAFTPARTEGKTNMLSVVLLLLLWGGLAYGGYYYANLTLERHQAQMEQRLQAVQAANEAQIEEMKSELAIVQEEMVEVQDGLAAIEEELELTGETIGGTNQTKQALQDRIDQLNKQLNELKTSLKKLEDAARAW